MFFVQFSPALYRFLLSVAQSARNGHGKAHQQEVCHGAWPKGDQTMFPSKRTCHSFESWGVLGVETRSCQATAQEAFDSPRRQPAPRWVTAMASWATAWRAPQKSVSSRLI